MLSDDIHYPDGPGLGDEPDLWSVLEQAARGIRLKFRVHAGRAGL